MVILTKNRIQWMNPHGFHEEAQYAVDDITERMRSDIHLDPDINYENYPVPSDLINAARDDLIEKISEKRDRVCE